MLQRVLEPEVMDSADEARDYDAMDHSHVNRLFVADFLQILPKNTLPETVSSILDVGTGTAQIPIELCRNHPSAQVIGIDLAEHMLAVGRANVERLDLTARIQLDKVDAKALPYTAGSFTAVISNSIVHHIPEPGLVLAEMVRVLRPGGAIFVRDLLRLNTDADIENIVKLYAADANAHQRKMFDDSLRAALTLDEIRALVAGVGFDPATVQQTSDRHWTWAAIGLCGQVA
jgi:ubiquinone/menaquinone biosynthesis C-methylase UbiE